MRLSWRRCNRGGVGGTERTPGSQIVRCGKKAFGWYKNRTFALLELGKRAFYECLPCVKAMEFTRLGTKKKNRILQYGY